MRAQDQHLKDAVAHGDTNHTEATAAMKGSVAQSRQRAGEVPRGQTHLRRFALSDAQARGRPAPTGPDGKGGP